MVTTTIHYETAESNPWVGVQAHYLQTVFLFDEDGLWGEPWTETL